MNELQIFKNEKFGEIRTVEENGKVWFVGKDIADALGYDQTSNMIKRLDEEDFISSKLDGMNMKSIHSYSLPGLIGHTTASLHDHSDMI